ncbi:hypothetical protein L202_05695 [Cryptococcus amylolentus CBS 6039]|uniref:Conserved oligomeric Golgi complex subunit 6 n=1 Tax=Cryptococcus amylolentus CBS 6039 TaxID=1295533 RepID=A0A1E3HLF6_9TREE|nr:hypothetical protein L202_05695 [Cryptococcus amylolentus CBS 6039]ODN77170.1 hypothetical protein L202_05695 [Cryptococcus amylolentus CBS 6039]
MAPTTHSRTQSTSTPAPLPSTRTNPISLRIYKAIGTSFDDADSREALQIASSIYAPQEPKGKSRAIDAEADEGQEEEDGLLKRRTLKGQSAATARKYLKRDVESSLAAGSLKFLEAFEEVDKNLGTVREQMQEMQIRCDQVQSELDQANSGTKYLLERADGLRAQRASAELRAHLITLFLARFTLSEHEQAALSSRDISIGQTLFDALDHVEKIREDCTVLLGGEEGKAQAGMDIMTSTSEQLEAGYTKIHRWCQFEFRQYTRETHLEVSPIMRKAIVRLRDRPSLLNDALQTLTSTRHASLLQQFLTALTIGGPGGLPRPIELHAHDPQRYVGDMLAWVHQTTASEGEFLDGVFGVSRGKRMVGQERTRGERDGEEKGEEKMAREVLDKNLEGLSRPLKLRIQQTIKSQEGTIMSYKIANLVQFYLVTMRKTIGSGAQLCETLQEIHDAAYTTFYETLDAQGRALLRFLHAPDNTLSPPPSLREAALILRELLTVHSTSLLDPADQASQDEVDKLLDKAVGPCIEMCERMAEMRRSAVGKGGGGEWERDVFMVNCLGYLEHTLEQFEFTGKMLDGLDERIGGHVEAMAFEHHGKLLDQCGLAPVMRAIRTRPADTPLSRLPATSPKPLTSSLSTFSTWLSTISPSPSSSPRLSLLSSPRLAEEIHRKALRKIYEAYGEVCDRVLDKGEGYEFGETMLRRGREEVGVALGVGEEWDSQDEEGEGVSGEGEKGN